VMRSIELVERERCLKKVLTFSVVQKAARPLAFL